MIFVDTAHKEKLENVLILPWVTGFTTNPTLVTRAAGGEPLSAAEYVDYCSTLCTLSLDNKFAHLTDMMIQGFGTKEQIKEQACNYLSILGSKKNRLWIKLLPTKEAFLSITSLKELGVRVLVTAVFSNAQAYLAMEAGADGIALYLGRLQRFEQNWTPLANKIKETLERHNKMFLIASLPNLESVETALDYSKNLTISPEVIEDLLNNEYSAQAVSTFSNEILSR